MSLLRLYNTESRRLEVIKRLGAEPLTMYTCGPTIYHFVHIGNLRTFVFEDLLRRTILYFGEPLIHVMNITDVDDKTIKGALAHKTTLQEFVEPYRKAFFEDLKSLRIQPAEHYPLATDYIPELIKMIQKLLGKGHAYVGKDQSVYFSIDSFPSYGKLSHLVLDELQTGASERVEADEYDKEHVADFVLWKAYDPERDGSIYWESPFGKGRPGWHIECSAMATKLLGETIDIHVGGVDNMFPHHENEIAQSECCSGHLFVRYWLHSEHLVVDGKKMSKSLGNFYTLRDLMQKGYTGAEVRYLLMQAHYRTQLNFTLQGLDAARHSLRRIEDLVTRLRNCITPHGESIDAMLESARTRFKQALGEDVAIPQALAALFDLVRELNTLCDADKLSQQKAQQALELFAEFDSVLGCLPLQPQEEVISEEVLGFLEQREKARKAKQWQEADKYRDLILQQGYIIEDTKAGPRLKAQR